MTEIQLDLRKHCIETELKRCQNRLLSKYFKKRGDDSEFEKQLVVLQKDLTQFDFPSLRSTYKELAGNSEARIILTENPEGRPTLEPFPRPAFAVAEAGA